MTSSGKFTPLKYLSCRLKTEQDIERAMQIMQSKELAAKHVDYTVSANRILYWSALIIAIMGNLLMSVVLIIVFGVEISMFGVGVLIVMLGVGALIVMLGVIIRSLTIVTDFVGRVLWEGSSCSAGGVS